MEFLVLEGETVLYGEDKIPGVVIHDDGERLCIKFFGGNVKGLKGRLWVDTQDVELFLEESMNDWRP